MLNTSYTSSRHSSEVKSKKYSYSLIKRIIDIILAIIIGAIVAPIVILIAIFIKIDSKGPIIFKQDRAGKNSKVFTIYKFRTMNLGTPDVPTSEIGNKGCTITKIGYILRKTSLDEIPQLINIIKGEMSFIGPRPLIIKEHKILKQRNELGIDSITPGITGWAQVNGRDELNIEEKVEYDYEYYTNQSLKFDLYIAAITIIKVLKAEGIKEG